jgi:hypothetical protein
VDFFGGMPILFTGFRISLRKKETEGILFKDALCLELITIIKTRANLC